MKGLSKEEVVLKSLSLFSCYLLIVAVFVWSGSLAVADSHEFDSFANDLVSGQDVNVPLGDQFVSLSGFSGFESSGSNLTKGDLSIDLSKLPSGVTSVNSEDGQLKYTFGDGSVSIASGTINSDGYYDDGTAITINRKIQLNTGEGSITMDESGKMTFESTTIKVGDRSFIPTGDGDSVLQVTGDSNEVIFKASNVNIDTGSLTASIPKTIPPTSVYFRPLRSEESLPSEGGYAQFYTPSGSDTLNANIKGGDISAEISGKNIQKIDLSIDGNPIQKVSLNEGGGNLNLHGTGDVELVSGSISQIGSHSFEVGPSGLHIGRNAPDDFSGKTLKISDGSITGDLSEISSDVKVSNLGKKELSIDKSLGTKLSGEKDNYNLLPEQGATFRKNEEGGVDILFGKASGGDDDVGSSPSLPSPDPTDPDPTDPNDPSNNGTGGGNGGGNGGGFTPPLGGGIGGGGGGTGGPSSGGLFGGNTMLWLLLIGGGVLAAMFLFGGGDDENAGSGESRGDGGVDDGGASYNGESYNGESASGGNTDGGTTGGSGGDTVYNPTEPENENRFCECNEEGCFNCPEGSDGSENCFECVPQNQRDPIVQGANTGSGFDVSGEPDDDSSS